MAATADDPVEPILQKTCILRASIHCQGCKRKVKKILTQVQGVEFVDVDIKQQKVTVTGDVDADTLIKKLAKSGKNAELWPQRPPEAFGNGHNKQPQKPPEASGNGHNKQPQKPPEASGNGHNKQPQKPPEASGNGDNKQKETRTEKKPGSQVPNPASATEPSQKPQPDSKNPQGSGAPVKSGDRDGGSARTNDENDGAAGALPPKLPSAKTNGDVVQEAKTEENKSEESCSESVKVPERKEAVVKSKVGGGESGTSGKKKKKKGQSGNIATSSAPSPPEHREPENRESGPLPPTNHSPPRSHNYPHPHSYYAPPPLPTPPVCAVSYNTAYPTSSYTASYYAAPPPYSYAYMHPVHTPELPPSDADLNPRQPLDSFEIFSDENPNGCFIM